MKLSDYLFVIPVITACTGWVVGIFSTYFVTGRLERRRAFRAIASEIESIRAEIGDYAKFDDIHKRTVESLKPLFFAAIPFLTGEKKNNAREAWSSLIKTDLSKFPVKSLASGVGGAVFDDPDITNRQEMERLLDNIQSGFDEWL
jgi:hypothetical protein